jgi:hypothetical protein
MTFGQRSAKWAGLTLVILLFLGLIRMFCVGKGRNQSGLSSLYVQRSGEPLASNELPRSWDIRAIERAAGPGRAHVLAWEVLEDDRPWRVERCLVLSTPSKDDGVIDWCLSHLVRRSGDSTWDLSSIHNVYSDTHSGWHFRYKLFSKEPKNKHLYSSLEEVGWRFEEEPGWRYVACCVCEKTWLATIGEKPTRFYGN